MGRRPNVVIFARAPVLGGVKRRLAADIGDIAALGFYRRSLSATLRRLAADPRWATWIAVTPDRAAWQPRLWPLKRYQISLCRPSSPSGHPRDDPNGWPGGGRGWHGSAQADNARGARLLPQGKGDLGQRMGRALAGFAGAPTVIVGSDIPGLGAAEVARALALLKGNDAVFGPAGDGGYWLVGVRDMSRHAGMFGNVRWSSPHALEDTMANLRGKRVALAGRLDDVDDGAALAAWRAASMDRGFRRP